MNNNDNNYILINNYFKRKWLKCYSQKTEGGE